MDCRNARYRPRRLARACATAGNGRRSALSVLARWSAARDNEAEWGMPVGERTGLPDLSFLSRRRDAGAKARRARRRAAQRRALRDTLRGRALGGELLHRGEDL